MTADEKLRFWNRINKFAEGPNENIPSYRGLGNCWIWTGAKLKSGYGQLKISKKRTIAHRVSWELVNGPIPEGLICCHKCDNPSCVNPNHLFIGTNKDNCDDRIKKGRSNTALGDKCGSRTKIELRPRGETHSRAKLSNKEVALIRKMKKQGHGQKFLSERFKVSTVHIWKICNNLSRIEFSSNL